MHYQFGSLTDTGKLRSNNEDAIRVDDALGLAVLADGMGGYNAGEVASGMAVELIRSEMQEWLQEYGGKATQVEVRRALALSVNRANTAIYNASVAEAQYAGMGTTLVLSLFYSDMIVVGHLGDSRAYRLRDGVLQQLTRDHSMLQEQLDAGLITEEEAQYSMHRNLVTRAMGIEEDVFLETNAFQVEEDDVYLLCSDGLSDMLNHQILLDLLTNSDNDLEQKAQMLINAANEAGGRDNISVVLMRVLKKGDPSLWGRFKAAITR